MKPLVLYHANCWDGFCAAWVAKNALGDIEAVPVQYGQEPPIDYCGRDVYILDFSYPRQVMRKILSLSHFVCVLDHHKTAQNELDGLVDEFVLRPDLISNIPGSELPFIRFDMNKSGGRLAWEYFWDTVYGKKYSEILCMESGAKWTRDNAPWLVNYTEDRDLWRHKLPSSREINASLRTLPLDFTAWDLLNQASNLQAMAVEGAAILRREKQIIDDHVRHAKEIEMAGHKILAVNATVLFSGIAGELASAKCPRCDGDGEAHGSDRPFESSGTGDYPGPCPVCRGSKVRPFGACYFDRQDGKRQWSLRSAPQGIDVSDVAKKFGGGGHKHAAGFEEAI